MKMRSYFISALCGLVLATQGVANDWSQFLGPDGAARSSDVVPTKWDETNNMLWKVDLPGSGSSSPIVVGDKVFVTCYVAGDGSGKRKALCFDKKTGDKKWSVDFPIEYREDAYRGYIREHGYASNTPASDGKQLFVFFGKGGVHALDFKGKILWSADVGKESSNRQWGSAASLLLFENSVIVNAAEESQAIIALNKTTGKEMWRQEAAMLELTYGTPRLVNLSDGKKELVVSVPGEIWALNPSTGKLEWFVETPMTGNISPSVVVKEENIYSFGGYRTSGSISVRAGGKDDVSKTHVNWTGRSSSYVATPLVHEGRFYWIDDRGLANSISAENGNEVYRERVNGLTGRPVYASPVLINGKIYVVTRRAGTIVYSPGDKFEPIAQNKIAADDTDFNASPAVSDNRLYLRSNQALYCIGEK
jgi:outer membrane protein assembly factor BamB